VKNNKQEGEQPVGLKINNDELYDDDELIQRYSEEYEINNRVYMWGGCGLCDAPVT